MVAIQQCPNKIPQVTFEEGGEVAKADFEEGSILTRGVKCQVIYPAPPGKRVLVYHYPYENDDSQVEQALSQFGLVKSSRGLVSRVSIQVPGLLEWTARPAFRGPL